MSSPREAVLTDSPSLARSRVWLRILAAVGFTAALAISAHIRIPLPFTPVPITLQTLFVLLAGVALGWRWAAASVGLYLVLGAAGLPVTTAGTLTGVTAGYLVGFFFAAVIVGLIARADSSIWRIALAMAAGTVIIYVCGAGWLAILKGMVCKGTLCMGVAPFLAGDVLKLAVAAGVDCRNCG